MTRFWRALNGRGKAATLGTLLLAVSALFAFLNGVPWATKAEVKEMKHDFKEDLKEVRQDVREMRQMIGELYEHTFPSRRR